MVNNDLCSLWEQRLADHETSGKSIAAWCREHSIRDNQFYYWRKKLRMDQVENNQPVKWLPLGLEQANLAPGSIAVHVGQATIEIKPGFDPHLLRQIAKVLQTI
jgi:transposase-like protein